MLCIASSTSNQGNLVVPNTHSVAGSIVARIDIVDMIFLYLSFLCSRVVMYVSLFT